MERVHQGQQQQQQQQQGWRSRWLSYKIATIIVCTFNLLLILFLLQSFLSASSSSSSSSFAKSSSELPTTTSVKSSVLLRHIKESEEIRRAMVPVDLIKRVREIEKESVVEVEQVKQKDTKQTAAVDLVSRLNNFRSNSDAGSSKALEEWRKRKMERARQRELGKNVTVVM